MKEKIVIYTDGGSKGNPGPSSIGVVIHYDGKVKEYGEQIGETTNNVAEYTAVIFALKKLKHLIGKDKAGKSEVLIKSDSELLASQLNGEYKVKNEKIKELFIDVWNLKQDFGDVQFVLVPREKNKAADRLVNEAMF